MFEEFTHQGIARAESGASQTCKKSLDHGLKTTSLWPLGLTQVLALLDVGSLLFCTSCSPVWSAPKSYTWITIDSELFCPSADQDQTERTHLSCTSLLVWHVSTNMVSGTSVVVVLRIKQFGEAAFSFFAPSRWSCSRIFKYKLKQPGFWVECFNLFNRSYIIVWILNFQCFKMFPHRFNLVIVFYLFYLVFILFYFILFTLFLIYFIGFTFIIIFS